MRALPKSATAALRLIIVGGCLVCAGVGVVYAGVTVVDGGSRSISVVAAATAEVAISYPFKP